MTGRLWCAFGVLADADFELPGGRDDLTGPSELSLRLVDDESLERNWGGACSPPVWETQFDGRPFRVETDAAGAHRFVLGERAAVLEASGKVLLCGPGSDGDRAWQRVLLDTALYSCRLLAGSTLLHAAAVAHREAAVAIVGSTGGGKTSLALALMCRGARLLSDDVVALDPHADGMRAAPGPPLMNLPAGTAQPPGASLLATFEESHEHWIAVTPEAHAPQPLPLAAIVLLERSGQERPRIERMPVQPLALLRHAIYFEHLTSARGSRFEVFSKLVERVPVLRLEAAPSVTPDALAATAEAAVFGQP